jgi:hypothetical protein
MENLGKKGAGDEREKVCEGKKKDIFLQIPQLISLAGEKFLKSAF